MAGEQGALTARGTVYPWQCDHMGHMNVMWYVGKFDEATWHVFTLLGLTPVFLRERQRGMAAVAQEITYQREMLPGAVYSIYSRVLEVREKVLRFAHEMRDDVDGRGHGDDDPDRRVSRHADAQVVSTARGCARGAPAATVEQKAEQTQE